MNFLRRFSSLQIALGVSVALHAVLLMVRFVDPDAFNRVFEDTPLEVVLVNARTNERPDKARAIAQANMAGGGEAERAAPPRADALAAVRPGRAGGKRTRSASCSPCRTSR